ncbi:AEC family transporter [Francisella frigiditurris]|uniref:Membrane transport family protein n=1 Tax=Francisella frigiditurris TaxID=1542390 RepID=A0A1J0KTF1_9GAMM|nr:AEC family transporter [Francisella frigiditurris]APC97033.1 membrane transport family protein [Francisella frigiditurris]
MLSVFNTTFVLFFTIFLGLLLGFSRIFPKGSDKTFIHLVFYVLLPMQLFLSCYHTSVNDLNISYALSYVLAMVIMIFISFIISMKFLKTSFVVSVLNTMSVSQVDGAYFAIPLFIVIFSSAVLTVPLMAIQNIIFFTVSVLIIEVCSSTNIDKRAGIYFVVKRILKVICTNPIIVSSILGFLFGSLKISLNENMFNAFSFLGKASAPIALFSIGLSCSYGLRKLRLDSQLYFICVLSLLKLMLFPFIALGLGVLFGLNHTLLLALVLLCATPTATHNYIIANQYNLGEEANTQTFVVVITTIFSFLSVNFWLYLLI